MKLKSIKFKNFRSYYGETIFELSEGLTLIIGGNGDGKTTFFEAIEWLFNTNPDNMREDKSKISAKRMAELEIGERDEVSVSITFEHDGEKELEKSFSFERANADEIRSGEFKFVGYENSGAERYSQKGEILLERCFDTVIRRYCLFKGESDLNVFDKSAALKTLVETFSGIKQFDEFVKLITEFEEKSSKAVNKEMLNDKKCKAKAKQLGDRLIEVNNEISDLKRDIKTQNTAISDYSAKLEILERNKESSEQYQDIKRRITTLYDKRATLRNYTNLDYNAMLLDESWILRSFPKVLEEYQKKAAALSLEKRRLDKEDTAHRAAEKAKIEVLDDISKGTTPLAWNIPDRETMQEMIDDEECKVCGRKAKKGSEAYIFMVNRLNEYLNHIAQKSTKKKENEYDKPLFPNSYIDELHTRQIKMSGEEEQRIASIKTEIDERLLFIQERKQELEKTEGELKEAEDEKDRLLIQSQELTEDLLEKSFNDIKGFFEQRNRAENRVAELSPKLKQKESEKEGIQAELNTLEPTNTTAKIYQRVNTALQKIMKAFANAKERNVNEFLISLEEKANVYLQKLNENDFYGIMRIERTTNDSANITLRSADDSIIHSPSNSQKTTMYMSVLFAISEITTLKREQDYPLIFDAPTSSFGGFKEASFYSVIDKIKKQCIIVTKDLLIEDKKTGQSLLDEEQINKLTCSIYRISKDENYSKKALSTISTKTIKIK